MREVYKKIVSISLLIIGLVTVIHFYIPHDHHYGYNSNACYHHNSNTNPIHCHFFNDINFDRASHNGFKQTQKKLSYFDNLFFDSLIKIVVFTLKTGIFNTIEKSIDDFLLLSVSPIRGSPLA